MVKLLLRALEELIMYRQKKKKKKANNASLDVKLVNVCLSGQLNHIF